MAKWFASDWSELVSARGGTSFKLKSYRMSYKVPVESKKICKGLRNAITTDSCDIDSVWLNYFHPIGLNW